MRSHLQTLLCAAAALGFACGPGSSSTTLIPKLPGDGDANTAKPVEPLDTKKIPQDPWDGRDGLIESVEPLEPIKVSLPEVHKLKLSNGLTVIAMELPEVPVVSMQLAVRVGRADATRDKMGIERLTAMAITRGTVKYKPAALAAKLEEAGVTLHSQSSFENTLISCTAMAKNTKACFDVLPEVVGRPTFPEAAIENARQQLSLQVLQRSEDPAQLAAAHFQNLLWGDEHVRGWPMSRTTIDAIVRKDVVTWHKRYFKPRNSVLAIAGDIDVSKLKGQLERAFRLWRRAGKVPKRKTYKVPKRDKAFARIVDWPGRKAVHIRIGHEGLAHTDKRFYAATVFNQILGVGRSSRFMKRVSSEPGGENNGATSGFDRNSDVGLFVASAITDAKQSMSIVRALLQEMNEMAKKEPTDTEMASAVSTIAGRYLGGFETSSQIANAVLAAYLHGLGTDYVESYAVNIGKVTAADAKKAAAEVLDPITPAIVIVGDAKQIEPQLRAVGVGFETVNVTQAIAKYERDPEPDDPKKASAQGRKILDKALAAKGGAARLKSIKTMIVEGVAKGTVQDPKRGSQQFQATVKRTYIKPDKMRRDLTRAAGKETAKSGIILDGKAAWAFEEVGKQRGAGELPPAFVEALRAQLWRDQDLILLRHLETGVTVAALPDRKIQGVAHYVVRVTRDDGLSATLFFDKKTYYLRRMTYNSQGANAIETYGDYRDVGGIVVAHRRLTVEGPTSFDVVLKKVTFNSKVDPKLFQKPKK